MARARAVPRKHAAQRDEIENWLEEKGIKWSFAPDCLPETYDIDRSLRNQARITQVLNDERVETYTEAMARGDKFPAVVSYMVEGKYVLIDGNHRLQAAINSGTKLSTYVVDADTDPTVIIAMTYEANAKHGLPNSVEDRQLHAVYLLRSGAASQENVAAALNLSKGQVQKAWEKSKADERAHDVGLLERQWVRLPVSARTRLGSIRTDEGFAAMADLAIKANLTTEEIHRHVVDINKASRSAQGQKQIVDELKPLYRSRVQASAGGLTDKRHGSWTPKKAWQIGSGQLLTVQESAAAIVAEFQDAELGDAISNAETLSLLVDEILEGLKKKQKGS